jgi:hypothetical protein
LVFDNENDRLPYRGDSNCPGSWREKKDRLTIIEWLSYLVELTEELEYGLYVHSKSEIKNRRILFEWRTLISVDDGRFVSSNEAIVLFKPFSYTYESFYLMKNDRNDIKNIFFCGRWWRSFRWHWSLFITLIHFLCIICFCIMISWWMT